MVVHEFLLGWSVRKILRTRGSLCLDFRAFMATFVKNFVCFIRVSRPLNFERAIPPCALTLIWTYQILFRDLILGWAARQTPVRRVCSAVETFLSLQCQIKKFLPMKSQEGPKGFQKSFAI